MNRKDNDGDVNKIKNSRSQGYSSVCCSTLTFVNFVAFTSYIWVLMGNSSRSLIQTLGDNNSTISLLL